MGDNKIAERLQDCADDPMWANYAEVSQELLREAAHYIRELEQENAALRAVAAEYDALIRHMDGGGDFHAFQRGALAAAKEGA